MDYDEIMKEQLNQLLEGEDLSSIAEDAYRLSGGISEAFTLENILNAAMSGESVFQNQNTISSLKSLFFLEIQSALVLCAEIISICIIMGMLKSLSDGFGSKSINQLSMMVCTMAAAGVSLNSFQLSYQLSLDTVSAMVNTMEILMPILAGILLATGAAASGTVLSPVIIASVTGFAFLVKTFILPGLFISAVLSIINCLTEKDYVNKLGKLIRTASLFVTGLVITVLSGIITVQGLLTETSDGLLLGAAKYSISSFIPIVGGFTSDTVELYLRCMGSIKSVVGVFGLLMVVMMMLIPLIKVVIIGFVYKLTAALAEPVTDSKIADGLNEMGNSVISMASILFFTSLLFIIFISTIIGIGTA